MILWVLISLVFISCNTSTQSKVIIDAEPIESSIDTIIVKIENKIDKPFQVGFYSKSITYCWIVGNDTLDFKVGLNEHLKDKSVHLRLFHRNPFLFSNALDRVTECLPLIMQDFDLTNLSSLYFPPPVFYKDLTTELSKSHQIQFGQRNIKYPEQNEFLMNSWLEQKVGAFVNQFDKRIGRIGIEKFHLLEKEHYYEYIPTAEMQDYPSFSVHGMGISVILKDRK